MDQQHDVDTEEAFWRLLAQDNTKFLMFMCYVFTLPTKSLRLQTPSTEGEARKRWEDLAVVCVFNLAVVIV